MPQWVLSLEYLPHSNKITLLFSLPYLLRNPVSVPSWQDIDLSSRMKSMHVAYGSCNALATARVYFDITWMKEKSEVMQLSHCANRNIGDRLCNILAD